MNGILVLTYAAPSTASLIVIKGDEQSERSARTWIRIGREFHDDRLPASIPRELTRMIRYVCTTMSVVLLLSSGATCARAGAPTDELRGYVERALAVLETPTMKSP